MLSVTYYQALSTEFKGKTAINTHVTIRDVASSAGVSTATVSRVVSGDGYVSVATRERVEKSIKKLGYSPSFAAQSLRTKKSTVIGLVITDIQNPFYPELVGGVEDETRNKGYSLILCNAQEDIDREISYIDYLASHRTDGILICAPGMVDRHRKRLKKFTGSIVLLNENSPDSDFATVTTDNIRGGLQIGKHLKDLNVKKIFYLGSKEEAKDSYPRFEGLKRGAKAPVQFVEQERDWTHPEAWVKQIMKKAKPPFAFVAHNDISAIASMHEFMNQGLEIPRDVAIVGYDDIAMSALVNPSLTTVNQKLKLFAQLGMRTLESLLRGESGVKGLQITPELVIRDSSLIKKQATRKGSK